MMLCGTQSLQLFLQCGRDKMNSIRNSSLCKAPVSPNESSRLLPHSTVQVAHDLNHSLLTLMHQTEMLLVW
jgi:hypothetical protein